MYLGKQYHFSRINFRAKANSESYIGILELWNVKFKYIRLMLVPCQIVRE